MATHECLINHDGSAGAMEAAGLVDCFRSSVEKNNLCYTKFLGDGDCKSHADIVADDPYPGNVEKLECIGHIQKRVGGRLRKLKQSCKENLDGGKKLGGAGRLREKDINKLQNYYGIAIRQCAATSIEKGCRCRALSLF